MAAARDQPASGSPPGERGDVRRRITRGDRASGPGVAGSRRPAWKRALAAVAAGPGPRRATAPCVARVIRRERLTRAAGTPTRRQLARCDKRHPHRLFERRVGADSVADGVERPARLALPKAALAQCIVGDLRRVDPSCVRRRRPVGRAVRMPKEKAGRPGAVDEQPSVVYPPVVAAAQGDEPVGIVVTAPARSVPWAAPARRSRASPTRPARAPPIALPHRPSPPGIPDTASP